MKPYKIIEHTADIGIETEGASLAELFLICAGAVRDLIVDSMVPKVKVVISLSINADSREGLLVKWLEEILFLFETKELVPVEFQIDEISDTRLKAVVSADKFDPKIHTPKYQIKAVTYHDLAVREEEGRFKTRIIFDI